MKTLTLVVSCALLLALVAMAGTLVGLGGAGNPAVRPVPPPPPRHSAAVPAAPSGGEIIDD